MPEPVAERREISVQSTVSVRHIEGRKLLGTARHHSVVTDRAASDGGGDLGCTSGELLLLAMGSCAAGSLNVYFQNQGLHCSGFIVEVALEPAATAGARDRIVISPHLPGILTGVDADTIRAVISAGGVTSRVQLGSEVEIRVVRLVSDN